MIAHLRGLLYVKNTDEIILDIQGVGYLVSIPLSTFYKLPEPGNEIHLFISLQIREDDWQMFGFLTREEKNTFDLLLKVTKIGPKLARNILSHISPEDFKAAMMNSDLPRLTAIPGIGEKTGRRLLLELKDKIISTSKTGTAAKPQPLAPSSPSQAAGSSSLREDAIAALVSLGYSQLLAERTINQIIYKQSSTATEGGPSIEMLIKQALQLLAQ